MILIWETIGVSICKFFVLISPMFMSDEQEYMAHVAFWEAILGVHPHHWIVGNKGNTNNVSESNRSLLGKPSH
jgi:hypothetical protein